MTEPTAPAPETPRARRTRRQNALRWGLVGLGTLAVLLLLAFLGGRFAVLSPAGRDLVVSFVAGKQLGRYGRINVEGLSGDLWDDFTLERVTVTDAEGVWLEARNVRVDWSWLPLVGRTFHATEIEAEVVRLIRRPLVEPSVDPPGAMPLSIRIRSLKTEIEMLEGFSREYGRFTLDAQADVPRADGVLKTAELSAFSLTRPGDHLRASFSYGGRLDQLRLNLRAHEAEGGPLAGALGYSPDQPFDLIASIDESHLLARVRSGEVTPLNVDGRFDERGARVSGFADFAGSELLAGYARRVGPTARFGLAAVADADRPGFYGLGWTLRAENLTTRASGMIHVESRSAPDGINVSLETPSLTRLAGVTLAGPAAWEGVWRGDTDNWTLDGDVSLQRAALAGYDITRLSGPLDIRWRDGRATADADLTGAGGERAGMIGGLLGETPRARFQLTRQANGQLLLQSIDLTGAAVRVRGQGSRNLGGGLAFRGDVDVTDVGPLRRGASGGLSGEVRARQPSSGRPWTLAFDARGRRFGSGYGQLDRLLGPAPRLVAAGQLANGRIEVDSADLSGAAGRLAARGLIGLDGGLRLALNWTAEGPFAVGPVEIEGAASGEGALTGSLNRPRADLTARFAQIAAGPLTLTESRVILSFRRGADASDGHVTVTGASNYGPARAASAFLIQPDGVALRNLDVDAGGLTASGQLALRHGAPSSADLTFQARPGAFLASGTAQGTIRLVEGAGQDSAVLDVTGRNVRFAGSGYVIRTLVLNGRGRLEHLPFSLAADVGGSIPVQFDGTGVYARANGAQTVSLQGSGEVRDVAFTTRAPAIIALAGDGRVVRVDLGLGGREGGGGLTGELRQDAGGASITANLTRVNLAAINQNLRGQVSGSVNLRGAGDALDGAADLTLSGAGSRDAPRDIAIDGRVQARLLNDVLQLNASVTDEGGVNSTANLRLPVEASSAPLRLAVARNRPMSGDVVLAGEIRPIWDLVLGGERSLSGQVSGRAAVSGSINEPILDGRVDLRNGAFTDSFTGARLANLTFGATFDGGGAHVERFSATDGGEGTVSGSGDLNLRQGGESNFTLTLQRFLVVDNDTATAHASGSVVASRAVDGAILLSGDLGVDDARVAADPPTPSGVVSMEVVEVNRPGGDPEPREASERPSSISLDVRMRANDGAVRVVGRGLDVRMNLNARIRGTLNRPVLTGTARVARGDYEFGGKRFVFDQSGSVTLSTRADRIRLNLRAVREDPALTAEIRVTGTAAQPVIALTSTPVLPQDEILSQVLFGRSASQLSAIEAAQLASGVASLAGGGGFDILGNLAEFAGLDRLSFGGEASAMTVAGGKYLGDDVYFEVIGGGEGGAAVQVEWQARRNIAVTSRVDGQGEASLAVRWRRQSRPRGEGRPERRRAEVPPRP